MGIVIALAQTRAALNPQWRFFSATGALGGYPTFSTAPYEALTLGVDGLDIMALLCVAVGVVLGIAGAISGFST